MDKTTVIQQSESLPFSFDRAGESLDGWTCTISVETAPDIAPVVGPRLIPAVDKAFPGFLTSSETVGLSVGDHTLIAVITNLTTDEEERAQVEFMVSKRWA